MCFLYLTVIIISDHPPLFSQLNNNSILTKLLLIGNFIGKREFKSSYLSQKGKFLFPKNKGQLFVVFVFADIKNIWSILTVMSIKSLLNNRRDKDTLKNLFENLKKPTKKLCLRNKMKFNESQKL